MKLFVPLIAVALLSGCATPYKTVPEGYTGPTSYIEDSFNKISGYKVEFFYVEQIDGHPILNSRSKSLSANRGMGMRMSPVFAQRDVPSSKPTSLLLVARTEYAAPILALTGTVFQVKGTIEFVPQPNRRYVVRGELGESQSSVWLEDSDTMQLVGKKVIVEGSAKLGILEK